MLVVTFIALLELAKETLIEITAGRGLRPHLRAPGLHASLGCRPRSTAWLAGGHGVTQFPYPQAMASHDFDVLIVGSGLARPLGRTAPGAHAPRGRHHQAHAARWLQRLGQGGIAAVLADDDSFAAHIEDTLVAGAGLCDLATTRFVVENAPESIAWLRGLGVPFTLEGDQLHLTREGGHSARRIAHVTTPPARPCSAR